LIKVFVLSHNTMSTGVALLKIKERQAQVLVIIVELNFKNSIIILST